jgi:superfamily II DNA or RNA helicase
MFSSLPFSERPMFQPPVDYIPRQWHAECSRAFAEKLSPHGTGQLRFLIAAAVGCGKTNMAAALAAKLLNEGFVRRVVYVSPNKAIKRSVRRSFLRFGIDLIDWHNGRHRDGEPALTQGAILTYQSLTCEPQLQRKLCRIPTLVIFDEIHHLGDNQAWELAAREAFEDTAAFVIGLSGTPFRSDNREIPFVEYLPAENGLRKFRADYTYPLGRAIIDGVCSKPSFKWVNGKIEVWRSGCKPKVYTFDDIVSEEITNARLNGAVRHGSTVRTELLQQGLAICREERRKVITFLGGDSSADTLATQDARELLPSELCAAPFSLRPEEICCVVSENKNALRAIETFGSSSAWVLDTVNMVSEGVDIPELSAGIFLTSITSKGTTIQRIGRFLRGGGRPALVFMPDDSRYRALAEEIEEEIVHEIQLQARRSPPPEGNGNGNGQGRRRHLEGMGIAAWENGLTFNSKRYSQERVAEAICYLETHRMPKTSEYLALALEFMETKA